MSDRNRPAGLISVGLQTITLSDSTAVSLNSTLVLARHLRFVVETNTVRYRDDGTDPTLTTGMLLATNTLYEFSGYNSANIANVSFQRSTGTATVSVLGYRHKGDPSS